MDGISLNDVATLLGVVFGTSGVLIGIFAYNRDKARVSVLLQWDMSANPPNPILGKYFCTVTVTNTGRRTIYVSHAHITIPKKYGGPDALVLTESIGGATLHEGAPPQKYLMSQTNLETYKDDWRNLRAVIMDSTGKKWKAKKPDRAKIPSWAK